jgi:monoamine oxidase/V8-like Glu-specific endopeptidase
MPGSFYAALSSLLAPPITPADRQKRIAKLARRQAAAALKPTDAQRKILSDTSVAVIGGGLAGLLAARELSRSGAIVTVFEAGNEVGGRARSEMSFSTGHIIELGAELIGSIHPTWLALAREYGLGLIGRSDAEQHAKTGLEERLTLDRPLTLAEQIELAKQMTTAILHPLGVRASQINDSSQPWKQPSLKEYDGRSVADFLTKDLHIVRGSRLWMAMELLLVNNNVAPLEDMNLLGLLCLVNGGKFEQEDTHLMGYWTELEIFRSSEGCQSLALALARDLVSSDQRAQVRRRTVVTAIDLSQRPLVSWYSTDANNKAGATQRAGYDYVVFTVPPNAWRWVNITPVHPKDPGQVGTMYVGPAVKYFTELKSRVWIKSGGAPLGGATGLGQVWESTDEQMRLPGQNVVLSVFAGGRIPTTFEGELEKLYPGYGRAKLKTHLMNWQTEPFIHGAYASPAKGQIFTVGKALNQPFRQRMVFAGEHTSMAHYGYMEGALKSGLRAAEQIVSLATTAKTAARPSAVAVPAAVFGNDDRVRVKNTLSPPACWICAIDLWVQHPTKGSGAPLIRVPTRATGVLVGPCHVLTAAHVLNDREIEVEGKKRLVPVHSVSVSPGRNGDNGKHPLAAAASKLWHRPQNFIADNDYALIVVDRDLSQVTNPATKKPLGYWGGAPNAPLRQLDPTRLGDVQVSVVGYPGDRCGDDVITGDTTAVLESRMKYCFERRGDEWASTQWQARGTARPRDKTGLVLHDVDTYDGQSGSPVCLDRDGTFDLLAVHGGTMQEASGPPRRNRAARVTIRMLEDLRDWINAAARRTWAEVRNDALVFRPAATTLAVAPETAATVERQALVAEIAATPW